MRRFRFKTEEELKESREWAETFGMPKGWGSDKDLLLNLGKEITNPILLAECRVNGKIRIGKNGYLRTSYYVEIEKQKEMKRYRFKTKEEFGRDMPLGWVPQMLSNLGKELTEITPEIVEAIAQGRNFDYRGECNYRYSYKYSDTVEMEDLTRIPKEEWEDICLYTDIIGVETQNGDKFYLTPNADGFVNINLKNHTTSNYSDTKDIKTGLRQCLGETVGKRVYRFNSMQELIKWATT